MAIKDESRQPEPSILLENLLVDDWIDLNLTVHREGQTALVEEVVGDFLVGFWAWVLDDNAVFFAEFVEPLLFDEREAFVDQDVGVFRLVAALVHENLLNGWVVFVLLDLCLKMFVFTTEALVWDILRVKVVHQSVIELVPLAVLVFAFLSIFDEGVVVTRL